MQSKKQVTIWLVQDAISFSHPLLPSSPSYHPPLSLPTHTCIILLSSWYVVLQSMQ